MMRGSLSVEIVAKKKNPFILSSLCCCWIINEFVSKRKKNYYHDAIDLFIMFFCLDRCRISLRILQRKHEKKIDTEFFRKSCDCVCFFPRNILLTMIRMMMTRVMIIIIMIQSFVKRMFFSFSP